MPASEISAWYKKNLTEDFTGVFAGGAVVIPKGGYLQVCDDLVQSCPDFEYTCPSHDWKEEDGKVIATWVVKGTHTGVPYSPMPDVPAVARKEVPVACANDPEKLTFEFVDGKISKLVVDALPGGKGFSGPIGFYLQMGGDASKLPKPPP